ncbi:MAG: ComEC/Rec2 family competence protein [Bacteroidota bacterium]
MFYWLPYAMVRIALFLMAGILLGIYQPQLFTESFLWGATCTLFLLYLLLWKVRAQEPLKVLAGAVGLALLFLMGYLNVLRQTESRQPRHLVHVHGPVEYYEAVVVRYAEEREKSWKLEAKVKSIKSGDDWEDATGRLLLYFPKKEFPQPFQYGDVLLIKGAPQLLTPPANPAEFDYKRFLTFKNIHHQHFVRATAVKWVTNEAPYFWLKYAYGIRNAALLQLKSVVAGEREQAIAAALVLGVTDGLDNELLHAYAATGAMHVLAVSGLHVGIIYLMLLAVLKPLNKRQWGKWALALISIAVLWLYAFVTGLSPSVLRAVTMFSFVAIARPAQAGTNIYNTLAASAFCLLLYDPYLIMSVGFQLSFLAVLGIVAIQPMIYQWWEPSSWLLEKVWSITCVSIAAQIATFTLGLLYFHQFPNYFLFSNLFVIPGSFVVLLSGLVVLLAGWVAPVMQLAGWVLTGAIKVMNYLVFAVEALPFSLVENIYITTFQCWLLMLAIGEFLVMLATRRIGYFYLSSIFVFAFAIADWQHVATEVDRQKFTVYRVAGHTAIDFVERGKSVFYADSLLQNDAERIRFHIRPNRLRSGVDNVVSLNPDVAKRKGYWLHSFHGQSFLAITDRDAELPDSFSVDWLIVSNNSVSSLQTLQQRANCKQLILDSSNSWYIANKLKREAEALGWKVHSVLNDGAFDYTLRNTNTPTSWSL